MRQRISDARDWVIFAEECFRPQISYHKAWAENKGFFVGEPKPTEMDKKSL